MSKVNYIVPVAIVLSVIFAAKAIFGITSLSGDNFNSQAKETDLTIEQYNQLVKDCNSSGGTVTQRGVYDFHYSPTYVTCYKDRHEFKMKPEVKNVP